MSLCPPCPALEAQIHIKSFTKGLWLPEGEKIGGSRREGETPELEMPISGSGKQNEGCSHSHKRPQKSLLGRGHWLKGQGES